MGMDWILFQVKFAYLPFYGEFFFKYETLPNLGDIEHRVDVIVTLHQGEPSLLSRYHCHRALVTYKHETVNAGMKFKRCMVEGRNPDTKQISKIVNAKKGIKKGTEQSICYCSVGMKISTCGCAKISLP
jgi:hypothetical protein